MKRASELFEFEHRAPETPFVEVIWRTRSVPTEYFRSVAVPHWEIVVTRQRGEMALSVRGPETRASIARIPQHAEFLGITFRHGAFMPRLPSEQLVDGGVTLPRAGRSSFWLDGSAWQIPDFETADVFVDRLVRAGLLVRDPMVECALTGQPLALSPRSIQRRVRRATGLTRAAIRGIARADEAAELLSGGRSINDVVALLEFADQAHLTRALRRMLGETPAQLARRASATEDAFVQDAARFGSYRARQAV